MKKAFYVFMLGLICLSQAATAQKVTDAQKAAAEAAAAFSKAPKHEKEKEKPNYWSTSILTKLDFGQTSLTNWAAGGYNTISMKSFIDARADYAKGDISVKNRLQLDYGFIYSDDKPFIQKSDDRLYFESRYGHKAAKNLNYTALFSFKSQFSNSYKYPVPKTQGDGEPTKAEWMDARILKSGFLSPAYTNLGLGMEWAPKPWLSVNVAPLTGGFVIVSNERLRTQFGMEQKSMSENDKTIFNRLKNPRSSDATGVDPHPELVDLDNLTAIEREIAIGEFYRSARFEFGAQVKVDAKVMINDNFNYTTQLALFSDYLDKPTNIRVNWDNRFDWKLAKYFSLTVTTNLIYDDKVLIVRDSDKAQYPNGKRRIQFKESLGFGITYTFAPKRLFK